MLKFLLKIWPAFLPITIYVFWVLIVEKILIKKILRRNNYVEGQKVIGEKSTKKQQFSLQNPHFVGVLYASFIIAIITLISFAFK